MEDAIMTTREWKRMDRPTPVPGVAVIAVDPRSRFPVMLRGPGVRSAPGCWSLPTGILECGRSLCEQAADELEEELGLRADPATWRQVLAYENAPGDGWHWLLVVGAMRVETLDCMVNREPDKHSELRVHEATDLLEDGFWAGHHSSCRAAFASRAARWAAFNATRGVTL